MTVMSVPARCALRFRPERKLAEGGFGAVYYATQLELERPVALKILHPQLVEEREQVQRFMTEARVTAALRHPNVVTLIDHGVDDGVPWIAYEFVAGESLRARLARGRLPWREACEVAAQVAAALEAAHAQGVLHRDIKPDNILTSDRGHYKVADFGIAKVRGHGLTAQGVILGTPSYLSPVQIRGEAPGPDSDVYALGITLYELLTGEPPFVADNHLDTLSQHLTQPVPRVSERVPDVPPELDALLLRMLAKSRADRLGDASAAREALNRLIAPPADAVPPVRARRTTDTRPIGLKPAVPPRRRTGLALAAAAAALLAVLVIPRPAPPPPPPSAAAPLAPVEIPDFRLEPLAHSVRVAVIQPPGTRLAVELGRGEPPRWEPRATIDGEPELQVRELDLLQPDTWYRVRVRALDRPGDTPACLVRTLREVELKATPNPANFASVPRAQLRQDLLEMLPGSVPHPGLTTFLTGDVAQKPHPDSTFLNAAIGYAWRAPTRPLAEALFAVPAYDPRVRANAVALACYTGVPGAVAAARTILATADEPVSQQILMFGLARRSLPELFDDVEAAARRRPELCAVPGGRTMIAADRARARAAFERWMQGPDELRKGAARAFALMPGADTVAALERVARDAPAARSAVLFSLAHQRTAPGAARVAAGLQTGLTILDRYHRAVLGVAEVPDLLGRAAGANPGEREAALAALVAMPPGTIPPALLERDDAADRVAFSYAGVAAPEARAALRARALSERDRSGIALWALARCGDPAAGPRALALLGTPALDAQAEARQAIAAWVAGDLLLAEAGPLLERLAGTTLKPFARQCVKESLAWIAARRAPLSFMLPWGVSYLATDIPVRRFETLYASASELPPPGTSDADTFDLANLKDYLNPTLAYAGAGPLFADVKPRSLPLSMGCDGELAISRTPGFAGLLEGKTARNLLRIVIER